jgi:serine/threonine-protein kinase
MIPQTIGRYQIVAELGRGGMAVVYRAIDPNIGREVALKLMPRELSPNPEFRARFKREVQTVGNLRNPAIVPLHDADEEDGQPYLVMALMSGGSLLDRLRQGPIPVPEAISIINRLAPALDEAHSKGIIHRDLKPGNILLDENGLPYLSDFGIVKLIEATSMTSRGVVGTPAYMSPEHFRGKVTPQSDVYALGIILFQMLVGRLPFQAETPPEWMHAHIYDTPPSIRSINPSLPVAVDAVIGRALAKESTARFVTAGEMARSLDLQGAKNAP